MTGEPAAPARYPLSAAQRRLWFIAQFDPQSRAYHSAYRVHFTGYLDAQRLIASLNDIVARHESLRMHFARQGPPGDDVLAVVAPALHIVVPTLDAGDLAEAEYAAYERRFVDGFAREPFDLAAGPLIRSALLRVDATRHVLILVVHHIVFDRWSFGVLMGELAARYRAAAGSSCPAPPRVGYGQCSQAEAHAAAAAGAHLAYWRTLLSGERQRLELPADRARPATPSDRGSVVRFTIAAPLAARVGQTGAARGATPFMTFLAAFCVLLERSTGQTDLLLGTPVAGRAKLEHEALIGLFVNTLPIRVRTAPGTTFEAMLTAVRAATLEMLAHADVPFDRLVREELGVREDARNPFFGIIFNFHNTPRPARWSAGLDVRCEDVDVGTARFDLAAVLRPEPDGTLTCRFEYSTDLFEHATIDCLAAHFQVLLAAIADDPAAPIAQLALASAAERDTIAHVWSRPALVDAIAPPGGCALPIHELIAFNAAHRPDAPALIEDGGVAVTYGELEARANRLAHALRARGVARDVRVGLYLERSVGTVVAMLATLKAGGAYVPLDPAYPAERTAQMLASAGIETIVARRASYPALGAYAADLFDIDDPAIALHDHVRPPGPSGDLDCLAYVMFTSGSTGKPKAVAIAHRGVLALIARSPMLACIPADTALLHGALTFDLSVFAWAPLVFGARVAVLAAGPFSLAEFGAQVTKYNVSVLDLSTALFNELVSEQVDALRGLRRCNVGGDILSPAHSEAFIRAVPDCALHNVYGPTEATVIASAHRVRAGCAARRWVPIGRPIADARLYIVDDRGQPVPIGVPGELWIGGSGVARAYLNDPVLTQERFVRDPFVTDPGARAYRSGDRARWLPSGDIEFLGRADAQVKIRGFRVEPAEVEGALLEHPAVRRAAVVARGDDAAQRRLIGYVEARGVPGLTEAELRAFLKTTLPSHAIPARIVVLDELPKTSSGKLDRARLLDISAPVASRDALPRSRTERVLASIFEHLLGAERLGRDDDFFAGGGHSLLATRLIARVADTFAVDIPLRAFFAVPTVAGLAVLVDEAQPREPVAPAGSADLAGLSDADVDALLTAEFARSLQSGKPSGT